MIYRIAFQSLSLRGIAQCCYKRSERDSKVKHTQTQNKELVQCESEHEHPEGKVPASGQARNSDHKEYATMADRAVLKGENTRASETVID